ncbi:MAG: hypothetical protein MJ252_13635 [archaeon]|nr:hypothetical protein [archaeon]
MDRELLYNFLKKSEKESGISLERLQDNFIRSLAGASVATGVLGIGDRHSGNIMIKTNGLYFHIDFGHIFGNFKEKFGFKRERSVFLLTQDMAYVYVKTNNEDKFKNYCIKAYNILRKNGKRLLNLIITMASAGMPEFVSLWDLAYTEDQLQLELINEEAAGNHFLTLIKESVNEKYRILDNLVHNCIHA